MIVRFVIAPDDSISVNVAAIAAIRNTGNDLVIWLSSGSQLRVPGDSNQNAVNVWRVYWQRKGDEE